MAKFFGKRQVIMGTLVVALGVAVYLNYYFSSGSTVTPSVNQPVTHSTAPSDSLGEALNVNSTPTTYFEQARNNRTAARKEATEMVKDILNDAKISDEEKAAATMQIATIAKAIEQESKIEELVKAKGFEECIAYIEEDRCSIVVKSEELTASDTAKISQIVTAQSQIFSQNINIMAVK